MSDSLEEVFLAVDAVPPTETLVGQGRLAVTALQAFTMPVAVQHLQDETVHDVLVAARTHWDLCKEKRKDKHVNTFPFFPFFPFNFFSFHTKKDCLVGEYDKKIKIVGLVL